MKRKSKRWLLPLILILVVSLSLVGCVNDEDDTQIEDADELVDDVKDTADEIAEDVEEDIRDMTYDDIKITPQQAFDKFMELHPNAKVKEFELDKGLMEYEYKIEGYDDNNEYEVKINPVDGEIISDDIDDFDLDDERDEITKDHLAKIDSIIDKAKAEDGSDSELDEWNISIEDGKVVMEIEIGVKEYSFDMETEKLIESDM